MSRAVLTDDTAPEVEALQVRIWRSMSPLEKARLISRSTRGVMALALAGLRRRHPDANERELRIRMAEKTLGERLTRRAYPDVAESLGP